MEETWNMSQDGKGLESAKVDDTEVITDTQEFLNSHEGTDIEHNKKYADHDVATDKYNETNKNDIFITHEDINRETAEESVVTTKTSGGREDVDIIDMVKKNSKDEETSQSYDTGNIQTVMVKLDGEKIDDLSQKTVHMSVSIESIKKKIEEQKKHNTNRNKHQVSVKFRAEIDPAKNQSAELELRKEISQDMFSKMEILGQFNLGFIITRLGSDLFIIDQHATDEKYNFEMLQLNTVLQNQRLV
ncbi:mismatch repair endonuclease PMS2, partial [Cryptotermes secundus]